MEMCSMRLLSTLEKLSLFKVLFNFCEPGSMFPYSVCQS